MNGKFDLDAYLARIEFAGPVTARLETLRKLAELHTAAIPFENLNPLLGLTVELDIDALQRKMLLRRRGGWCFEQNLLFAEALRRIGFTVFGLAARVLWGRGEDEITARGHMLLRVELDGATYIADVGFGGMTLTGVLRLEADTEQATPHGPFRLIIRDGDWRMQAKLGDEWKSLYRFDLQRQYRPDYEIANHYLSTHPASHFLQGLMVARCMPGVRLALRNREFAMHRTGRETQRHELARVDEIIDVLRRQFLLDLSGLPGLEARLARLPHS
jgi:N-hydroxyarylamine O-acetyltransferase